MRMWEIPEELTHEAPETVVVAGEECTLIPSDPKCGGCNWEVSKVYMMGNTLDQAIEAFQENNRGLCGDCMCGLLVESEYQIIAK